MYENSEWNVSEIAGQMIYLEQMFTKFLKHTGIDYWQYY